MIRLLHILIHETASQLCFNNIIKTKIYLCNKIYCCCNHYTQNDYMIIIKISGYLLH